MTLEVLHRLEGGVLQYAEHAHNEDMGGIEDLADLDAGFADEDEYEVHLPACDWHRVAPGMQSLLPMVLL